MIKVDSPIEVYCDFDTTLLQQALLNLVVNAIDASPADSTVMLTGRNSGETVSIAVQNSGTGIDSEVLDHIFEPFFTTKPGGTGLGLAIARNAARVQGGDLTLTRNGPNVVALLTLTLSVRTTVLTKAES